MAVIGRANSNGQEHKNGTLGVGDKTKDYAVQKTREVIEEYNRHEVKYITTDLLRSQVNLYGEIKEIYIESIKELACKINAYQNDIKKVASIEKTNSLIISTFNDTLNEKEIDLKRGDYLLLGRRLYKIYNYTIKDERGVGIALGKQNLIDIYAYEESDEVIRNNIRNEVLINLLNS